MDAISDAVIEISAGDLSIGLVPEIGGSVAFFRSSGIDLMRSLSPLDLVARNVLGVAMFPMVPYANRIAGNAFDFGGRLWTFEPNNHPERFNVHGTGWHSSWRAERNETGVLLSLDHIAPDEPYSYRATQHFLLEPEGLTVAIHLMNEGGVSMPFGFGLHPWFERGVDTTLAFRAGHFFMEGPEGIATERLAMPPELDFAQGRALPDTWRNNDFGGWDGVAEIRFPDRGRGLRIAADPIFGHLMLYADPQKPFFCLEPQSNAPCAFNRMAGRDGESFGARILAPGESLDGTIRFLPFALT
ncbi:MAG: aldose 1-epimerase [Rhizobiaceae bacterium]|nr:aldose 1-epimerase [Rhizobiaceae bacterium]